MNTDFEDIRALARARYGGAFAEAATCTRNESERAVLHRRAAMNLTCASKSR